MTNELKDGSYCAKILCDSISPDGIRLTTMEITFPRIVLSEFNTHRTYCIAGDTKITIERPIAVKNNKKMNEIHQTIATWARKWFDGDTKGRSMRTRLKEMNIRCVDESTGLFTTTKIVNIFKSGIKPLFEIELENSEYKIKITKDHKFLTKDGWKTLSDINLEKKNEIWTWDASAPDVATNGFSLELLLKEKENGLTRKEISEKYNVSYRHLEYLCSKHNITFRKKIDTPNEILLYKDKEWLQARLAEGLFATKIAELCNTEYDRVKKSIKKHGLKGNTWTWGSKQVWNKGKTYKLKEESLTNIRAASERRRKPESYKKYKNFRFAVSRFLDEIRQEMYEKYDFKCQLSGSNQKLELHHIDPIWNNKELAFDKENIIVLSKEMHQFIHKKNIELELLRWIKEKKSLKDFIQQYEDIKLLCNEINKPTSSGNRLILKYSKIKNIKYIGEEETFDLELSGPHNFVANGIIVHNSRNSASSRAIPVQKQLDKIKNDPFVPEYWGKNQKGMQADFELSLSEQKMAIKEWHEAKDDAMRHAENLLKIGVHKQITNRLLEPFMYHTVICTATDWSNFFALRCHPDAQPEIRKISLMMKQIYDASVPKFINYNEWHLPLIQSNEKVDYTQIAQSIKEDNLGNISFDIETAKQISTGRCARISYLTHDGKRDLKADIELYANLSEDGHQSPAEHVARPLSKEEIAQYRTDHEPNKIPYVGNFKGWFQFRKEIPFEHDFSLKMKDK